MSTEGDRVELAEYARILWKRRWLIAVPTVLTLVSAFIALRYMTPIYVADAVLKIMEQDAVTDVASAVLDENKRRGQRVAKDHEKDRLKQIRQEVTGTDFLELVGGELGMDTDPTILRAAESRQQRMPDMPLDALVIQTYTGKLKGKIDVAAAGINLFQFTVEDEDPRQAYDIVSAVAREYRNYLLETGSEQTDRTEEFARKQLEAKQVELGQAEQELRNFQARIHSANINSGNPITEGNLSDARLLVDEAGVEITRLGQRVQRGLERLDGYSDAKELRRRASSPRLDRLAGNLIDAERDEVPLAIQGTSANTDVSRLRQDLFNEMRDRVAAAYPDADQRTQNQIGDVIFDSIVLDTVIERKQELNRLIRGFTNRSIATTDQDLTLEKLDARVDELRALVSNLEETLRKSEFKEDATRVALETRVQIIAHPEVPQKADRPNRLRILLMALAAGPLLGIGAVVLLEYLDTSLKTIEEVEEVLGLPVLGTIPKLVEANMHSGNRKRRTRRQVGAAGMILILLLGAAAAHDVAEGPGGSPTSASSAGSIDG